MPRPTVQDALIAKHQRIEELIEQMKQQADKYFDLAPEQCHWGHVGDLSHFIEGLENTLGIERH